MLNRLKQLGKPIRVGIIGTGFMGTGLVYQTSITPGISCVAIADINIAKAIEVAKKYSPNYKIVTNQSEIENAIKNGYLAVCEDGDLIASCSQIDVMIESTDSIIEGAQFSVTALENKKHLILMNAEIDLLFGPYFMSLAKKNGVVFSSCDGDQPGVLKRLIDEIKLWGLDFVLAGNIKGYLDLYANPTSIIPEADKRSLGYKMATSFTDGTKAAIEMALIANACKAETAVTGMFGPKAGVVQDALTVFDLPKLWKNGVAKVDYLLGAEPGPGVFVIAHCDNDYQKNMLSYYKLGNGPFYVFYRPYHLCHIESMRCVAEAVLDGESLLQPSYGFLTNVYAYAKKDLNKGDLLDGIGGYTCYGLIENVSENKINPGLPIGLADQVTLLRDIKKDEKINMQDIVFDSTRTDFVLFEKALETVV